MMFFVIKNGINIEKFLRTSFNLHDYQHLTLHTHYRLCLNQYELENIAGMSASNWKNVKIKLNQK